MQTGSKKVASGQALSKASRSHFRAHGRQFLPWRTRQTLYRVLISEIMLQQTQVERVMPKFNAFTRRFSNWQSLANAELPEVYRYWRGLGYNRRAKYLRDAARAVVADGHEPRTIDELRKLPGVGPYTAGAVAAFAFGNPDPFVETNIRTAVLYHCFSNKTGVHDKEILLILETLRPSRGNAARNWYAALMDYGAHLKKSGVRLNNRARGYAKQSRFEGSLRQLRGAILRLLSDESTGEAVLIVKTRRTKTEVKKALAGLLRDGLVEKRGTHYSLAK